MHVHVFIFACSMFTAFSGYFDIIKHPMDFTTMRKRLSAGEYRSLQALVVRDALSMHAHTRAHIGLSCLLTLCCRMTLSCYATIAPRTMHPTPCTTRRHSTCWLLAVDSSRRQQVPPPHCAHAC